MLTMVWHSTNKLVEVLRVHFPQQEPVALGNLGSTGTRPVEAGEILILSFLVNNLLLRWDKPSGGVNVRTQDGMV